MVPLIPEFLNRRRLGFTYPLRVMEELGIDRPTFAFVVSGVALQSDEGARMQDLFNPYPTAFDQWDAAAASARGAGLADEVGGRWRITPKGRELFSKVRREADAYLATLEPIPAKEIVHLAAQLARALVGIESSGLPFDHMQRNARVRGDGKIPMVALENALFGLWQARDDSHMAAWRDAGFDGPTFDVLTRVWRNEAADEDELSKKMSGQSQADIKRALMRLRADGYVRSDALSTTERGASVRQQIEEETDRRFFEPWPDDLAPEAPRLRDQLRAINAALAPAA
jgi:DNA-binding MarR family transcriptional regulator